MKKWNRPGKNQHLSMVSVILWLNLLSLILLTAFNYYFFHRKAGKAYHESFISYNLQVTDLAFKNIDEQIMQSVLKLPQLYFSPLQENAPILLPMEQSIEGSSKNIMALATEMQKISKSHPHVAGIDIYYQDTNTVVTHFNKVHFPQDEQQLNLYLPWLPTFKNVLSQAAGTGVWLSGNVYLSDQPAILYVSPIGSLSQGNAILCAYISPESFSGYLDQTAGKLLITTRDHTPLYSSAAWDSLPDPDWDSGPKELDGYMVFHNTSPTSGLNYYYAVDSNGFYQDYRSINHLFLFNFLLSIIFNAVMLMILSFSNHTAYSSRVRLLSQKTGIPLEESEKSFDGSLNRLEKEIRRLYKTAESSHQLILHKAVYAELANEGAQPPSDTLLPYLTREYCCAALITLPQADADKLPLGEFQEEYPPGRKSFDVLFSLTSLQSLAAVLAFNGDSLNQVQEEFIKDMDSRLSNYRIAFGNPVPVKNGAISSSFQLALEADRYMYIFTEKRILSYDQLHVSQRKNDGSHLKLFEAVQRSINSLNLLELQVQVEMLVTSFKSGNYTIDYCQSTLRDLVSMLYRAMQQNQLDTWSVFGYDIRAYYKKLENIDDFRSWCSSVCETILRQVNQKRQSVDEDLKNRILELVDEYLERDITLDLLADKLKIQPNSASRLFRQVMGTGYTDYIKNRKLERAKELISQGYNVKETAERLGYSSAQYFIKVFKESYSITPNQYKKTLEQQS